MANKKVVFILTHRPHKFWEMSCIDGEDYNKIYLDGIFNTRDEVDEEKSKLPSECFKYISEVVDNRK